MEHSRGGLAHHEPLARERNDPGVAVSALKYLPVQRGEISHVSGHHHAALGGGKGKLIAIRMTASVGLHRGDDIHPARAKRVQ